LLVDSSGVISVRILSNGAISIEKVGELMGAPMYRFGNDTGETERMLMEYLQKRKTQFRIPFYDLPFAYQKTTFFLHLYS
jgi:maltoporin